MKTIAGSSPSRSSRSTTSTRLGIHTRRPLPTARGFFDDPGLPLRGDLRSRINRWLAQSSRATRVSSSLTGAPSLTKPALASTSEEAKRVKQSSPDHDVLEQRDRPAFLDDRGGVPAHRLQPLAELLRVGHRRRQRHQGHRLGEVDDDLLPHGTAHPVGEVVDLVHHHEAQADQRARAGVEHVAQHLGRHHDDRSLPVDHVVAGEQADLVGTVALHEVVVLLVRQGLDRRGVERLASGLQREVDGELAHDRLARPGGGRDQHPAAVLDLLARPDLEVVELEPAQPGELAQHRVLAAPHEGGVARGVALVDVQVEVRVVVHAMTSSAPGAHSTVSGRGPKRSPSAYVTMPGAAIVAERTLRWTYSATPSIVPVNRRG